MSIVLPRSLNSLCIDCIVFAVCTDEPDVDDAIGIVDPDHDSILVSSDIEHYPTIFQDTCSPEMGLTQVQASSNGIGG